VTADVPGIDLSIDGCDYHLSGTHILGRWLSFIAFVPGSCVARNSATRSALQAEYLEMPGLQLTKAPVRRLWSLEEDTCDGVLTQLVATHFLRRTARDVDVLDAPVS
jgi:hypothetical protein